MSATTSSDPRVLTARFDSLRQQGRRALVVYVTAGHPDPERSAALLTALDDAGADVIEVGIPFSDPMADGPVIQASSQRALEHGMTFDRALDLIAAARLKASVVLFSYLNPILAAGPDALTRAAAAGSHGLLVTDLPVGSDPELESRLSAGPLAFVRLVAPTTPTERMSDIAQHGSGFVYLISRLGVTGARAALPPDLPATIARLREATRLPICVGFGVSTGEQAAAVARMADGVVVGSAVVKAAEESVERAAELVRELRRAIDAA
ncbi:MAG TPA: tryptophan synthase subunit alpha [Gemmatimonadaceae bacterium]|nr:tryptophan synthase subunit alpha [Gemmatimonadaceae bacterium]